MFGEGFRHCRFSSMIVLTGVGLLAGCGIPKPTVCELERGAIWIFPGIFGGQWFLADARRGFRDAGVDRAILGHDWNRPPILGTLANLMDEKGNRLAAEEVAGQIKAYREAHPRAPISLVGYSGGAGMVLMVAEALPEDIRLGNMILAHGAVSPDYDLEKVMKRLDGKLVNFHSSHDWLMLGLGTQVFGTMDRKFVASAGKDGFVVPAAVQNPALRSKLEQRTWSWKVFKKSGHIGDHFGILSYKWNKTCVAPYLMEEGPR